MRRLLFIFFAFVFCALAIFLGFILNFAANISVHREPLSIAKTPTSSVFQKKISHSNVVCPGQFAILGREKDASIQSRRGTVRYFEKGARFNDAHNTGKVSR